MGGVPILFETPFEHHQKGSHLDEFPVGGECGQYVDIYIYIYIYTLIVCIYIYIWSPVCRQSRAILHPVGCVGFPYSTSWSAYVWVCGPAETGENFASQSETPRIATIGQFGGSHFNPSMS